jgi:predicted DNA-binding transcriptional regulator AlpA
VNIDNEPKPPRFVDLPELSRRLCLQKSAIYELFASGEMCHTCHCGRVRIAGPLWSVTSLSVDDQ